MAKLYFRYGAMNSGKSTGLLQAAFNYEERGQRVLLAKPQVDSKGEGQIVSRLGVTRPVDFLIPPGAGLMELFRREARGDDPTALLTHVDAEVKPVACLLVDEAQFLEPAQVDDLLRIAVLENVPVMAYGIRTDFRTASFPGSARLMELAHSLEELKTICRCGRKAIFNTRKVVDTGHDAGPLAGAPGARRERFVFEGDQVAIDGVEVTYESLCGVCYLDESGGRLG
ncbi:thymidine kinase [Citricoccus sp. I39-566]|uniref:thymidine kinase n=1 Tax=Citricoccus sp. I39-566 TaxID=3073268 RepID=UPI00286CFD94|nr:thymidine kinase [Citricoccus sp. I39-566]WMY78991.1 thymidine kinase [Citricoccus sp. I39-566]